jgi:formylglycine-generating enzyme required for sulfatase activity
MNPTGASSGSSRVIRGGSWYNLEGDCRVSYRYSHIPGYSSGYLGLRVAFPRN